MIPSGNVVSVVSCCSSVLLAYNFASESIKFEQPSISLGFRLRVLLRGSVSVENAGGVNASYLLFSRLHLPDVCIIGPHSAGNSLQTYASGFFTCSCIAKRMSHHCVTADCLHLQHAAHKPNC